MSSLFYVSLLIYLISRMSIIKEFSELNLKTKSIIISVCINCLFWFLLIFYHYPIIKDYTWYVIVALVLTPSICWFALFYASTHILLKKNGIEVSTYFNDSKFWINLCIDNVIYIVVPSIIMIYFGLSLFHIVFILLIYRIIVLLIAYTFGNITK